MIFFVLILDISPDNAIILAWLCSLARRASFAVDTFAHIAPFTLLHAIDIPIPVPQSAIAKSACLFFICSPSAIPYLG